jgi:hypothetical protein
MTIDDADKLLGEHRPGLSAAGRMEVKMDLARKRILLTEWTLFVGLSIACVCWQPLADAGRTPNGGADGTRTHDIPNGINNLLYPKVQRRASSLSTPMIPEFRARFRTTSKFPGPAGPAEDSYPASLGATSADLAG